MCHTVGMSRYTTHRLAALGGRHRELVSDLAANRKEIIAEIIAARRAGVSQGVVVALSGYSREQIRRIERAHGIGGS